jgi:hypothetical protein
VRFEQKITLEGKMTKNKTLLVIIMIMTGVFMGCNTASPESAVTKYLLYEYSKNDVDAVVWLEARTTGEHHLLARFSPLESNLHLYCCTLPSEGIDGVGRPTSIKIISGPLVAVGDLAADKTSQLQEFEALNISLPVYPEGPVTLMLPVGVKQGAVIREKMILEMTYMACSSKGECRPPVKHQFEAFLLEELLVQP